MRFAALLFLCATSTFDVAHAVSGSRPVAPALARSQVVADAQDHDGPEQRPGVGASAWVDPFIGTAGRGGTLPGATRPWGMVSASPHTAVDVSGGYRHGQPILGFGQVHFSGSPPVLGLVLLRAYTGAPQPAPIPSRAANEIASPGYYAADLVDDGVRVEATATARTTLYRFTFRAGSGPRRIAIDAAHSLGLRERERARGGILRVTPTRIEGWAEGGALGGLGGRPRAYFVAELSRGADSAGSSHQELVAGRRTEGVEPTSGWWRIAPDARATVLVRIGISYVDVEGAGRNLAREQRAWDFDGVRDGAAREWDGALARIRVDGGVVSERRRFYTALYHSLLHPSVFSDVDGRYRTYLAGNVGQMTAGHVRYSGFSLWDTFRTVHPLLAVAYPERAREMTESLLAMQRESGWLPQWELAGTEANAMVGDPAAIVVAEAYLKGVVRDGADRALAALLHNATVEPAWDPRRPGNKGRIGLSHYTRLGYVPEPSREPLWDRMLATARALAQRITDTFSGEAYENARIYGSVSTSQDYAHADACVGRLATMLGRQDVARRFEARSHGYRLLYDSAARWPIGAGLRGAYRPRLADGTWAYPPRLVDPRRAARVQTPGFVEGDEWSYLFNAPHDVPELVRVAGSVEALRAKLDAYFDAGAYDPSNEPPIAYPYLYAAAGRPAGTQSRVRALLRMGTFATRLDLPGEDDAGALSAWVVWSALGLYPYDPCSDELVLGSPTFPRVRVTDTAGRSVFGIDTDDSTGRRGFIRSARLNGRTLHSPVVPLSALRDGATLGLSMQDTPSGWGAAAAH